MHDHLRFQRDINDVTGVSLSLYLSQKSLMHNLGSASALPVMKACFVLLQFEMANSVQYAIKVAYSTVGCRRRSQPGSFLFFKTPANLVLIFQFAFESRRFACSAHTVRDDACRAGNSNAA